MPAEVTPRYVWYCPECHEGGPADLFNEDHDIANEEAEDHNREYHPETISRETIRCTWLDCGQTWPVPADDPDAALSEALGHVNARHHIGLSMAHNFIEENHR